MRIILFTLFFLITYCTLSQKYNFRYYGPDQGLPQQSVLSMISNEDGIMCIGTQGGFSKFDGKEFYNLTQKDGLNSNHVTSIYQNEEGDYWLGHRYDAPTYISEDTILPIKGGWADSIRSSTMGLTQFKNKIWFVTEKEGLFTYEISSQQLSPYVHEDLKGVSVNTLLSMSGSLILGTDQGLYTFSNDKLEKLNLKNETQSSVIALEKGDNNQLYMLTNDGLYKIKLRTGQPIKREVILRIQDVEFSSWKGVVIANSGEYWIHSVEGAIHIKNGQVTSYTSKNGLGIDHVESIAIDREGNPWFGTFGAGLYQLLGEDFLQIDEGIGLVDNKVTAISTFRNEAWVTTEGGVSRIYYKSDELINIDHIVNYTSDKVLIDDEVFDIVHDNKGNAYMSSMNGVVYFSRENQTFTKLFSSENGLSTFNISIEIDDSYNIWLGSLTDGVTKFSLDSNYQPASIKRFNTKHGFFSNEIWTIFCDSRGDVWIGSNNNGLVRYQDGEFSHFSEKEGLKNERPGSITEDINGNIWLGTIGGGIFKFDGATFTNYNSSDGIKADNPYFVAGDDLGNVWIGSNEGVDRFNIQTEEINFFGKSQGFKGVETNQNAFYKDENGTMWFGTIGGVMQCFPSKIKPSKVPPLITIDGIRIFLKSEDLSQEVSLDYTENYITFDFTGVHYESPDDVKFSFKLDGFDGDWSPLTSENAATYSNLSPGDYTFYVKARNRSGIWSEPASFRFYIEPPFWMTWWFRVLIAFILLGVVIVVFRMRTRKLRKQREFLKKEVRLRTKELESEKVKVEQFNHKLTFQNELLAIKNKDITDSIRYAQRIQQGMLPGNSEINEILPKSFILYKPRDIVSGDFYWCRLINNITCFAAIDCTGHGVPGAFMSLIGNDLLNQAAQDPKLKSTGDILTAVHNMLRQYFLKEGSVNVNDGMDMSICAIKPNKILQYSGAKRPLYLVRNKKVIIYKGDRYSIGETVKGKVDFTTNEIPLESGDMIYIFSDGYQDQFGGKEGKKFMTKQLRKTLIEISEEPVEVQHQILNETFENWKGEHDQVDDVLIWGLRIDFDQ